MSLYRAVAGVAGATLFFCLAPCVALTAQQPEMIPTVVVATREVPVSATKVDPYYVTEILDLKPKDFHVDVEGKEQQVSQVRLGKSPVWEVHDDDGYHYEGSPSFGVWSDNDRSRPWGTPGDHLYYVSFILSDSQARSCYKLRISINRPDTQLGYPDKYCRSTSADPLGNTKAGLRLQAELESKRKDHVRIDSSVGTFLSERLTAMKQIAMEFPGEAFRFPEDINHLAAPVGMLGTLYTPDMRTLSQFSDMPPGSDYWLVRHGFEPPLPPDIVGITSNYYHAYTRQFELPAGEYSLRLVLDKGGEFGRIDIPIRVPAFDPARLWISSLFLCRRFHQPTQDELEKLPPQYTPLISEGTEFEPAGDTRFTQEERLHLWFQIYAPPSSVSLADSIRYEIKLVNLQTGKVQNDTGASSVSDFTEPGKPIVPVWKEVLIGKLPPGTYRVDVQATDSVTGNKVQSSNTFTMVKEK